MAETILAVKDLSVSFLSKRGEAHRAVSDLSLTLGRGETLAVVGQSGSGKTSLLRALLGLIAPSAGSVELFGRNLQGMSASELARTRQRCGYVPQDPYGALPPGLSVLEAVLEPLSIAGRAVSPAQAQEKARSLLSELNLKDERILMSRALSLSGGQRQRVELARALVLEPELLLCDEPTSMQDLSLRGEIIEVLDRCVQQGMAMVFVTHDLRLAARSAERILVMHQGQLCEVGPSKQVMENPRHEYTQRLIAAIPHPDFGDGGMEAASI